MTLDSGLPTHTPSPHVFYEFAESQFYGDCVETLLLREDMYGDAFKKGILEFGPGSGIAVAAALRRARFSGIVRGIEIDAEAYKIAQESAEREGVNNIYKIEYDDFFGPEMRGDERCAVGNPPYLPSKSSDLLIPGLWGGEDGADAMRHLLNMGFDVLMMVMSSISNPVSVLKHGHSKGYVVEDWLVRPLTFGQYSKEPAVWNQINALEADGKAFFRKDEYLIAGVTWAIPDVRADVVDRSASLERALTSLV